MRPAPPVIREAAEAQHDVARRDRRYRRWLAVADALSALVALAVCAQVLGDDRVTPSVLLGLPLVILACKLSGLYNRDELLVRKTTVEEAPAFIKLALLYTFIVWMLDDILIDGLLGKTQALVLWFTLSALGLGFRRAARYVASRSVEPERLLVVGDASTYARLRQKLEMGGTHAELVGRLSLQRIFEVRASGRPLAEDTMSRLIRDLDAHRVVVVPSHAEPQVTLDVIRSAKALGVRVSLIPEVFDVVGHAVVFDNVGGMTLLGVREFALSRSSLLVKRAFDLAGALACLVLVAPVFALIALLIKLDSRGPVFFRQERVGRDGKVFRIFKFRSMVVDAEQRKPSLMAHNEAHGLFKIASDPRVTRLGGILRRTSLDELPQLINVLRGEMSLVGPRPLINSEDETITGFDRQRLQLTPGMTGHWQIMGSSRVPLHEMVKIDYLYVTTWSLFEDLKILVRTVPYMLARRGM